MKKRTTALLCILCLLWTATALTGCSLGGSYPGEGKRTVTVSMYNSASFPRWRAYVEEQCPEVYLVWENNRDAVSHVLYQAKHDDMPDIVCIRCFESDTARELAPYLLDLTDNELARRYYPEYLSAFTLNDKLCWLPAPGVFDGIVAHVDLFADYGIPLPTDLDSFISACEQFEAAGIRGFISDCAEGETTAMLTEGFGLAPFLATPEGRQWRAAFESGATRAVDEAGWSQIAATLRRLCAAGVITPEDTRHDGSAVATALMNGEAAMGRKSTDAKVDPANTKSFVALPVFGATPEDSWLYTYPVFSLALAAKLAQDPARQADAERVLAVMLSEEAQLILNEDGEGLVSYHHDFELPLTAVMEPIRPYIETQRAFLRILSSNMYGATQQALHALVLENASADEFIALTNAALAAQTEPVTIGVSNIEADNAKDRSLVSPAASVIAQTVLAQLGADGVIIDAAEAFAPIYRGTYTDGEVNAVVMSHPVYTGTLTGAELRRLLETCMTAAVTYKPSIIEPLIDYPALAGLTVHIDPDTPVGAIMLPSGEAFRDSAPYRIAISAPVLAALDYLNSDLTGQFTATERDLAQLFVSYWVTNGKLPAPNAYYIRDKGGEIR